ncbi:MAG: ABC transporter substrate-binding protein [Propionibacteriaceae bacterium]|jgi:peptide/nickel transport system substrate-binding protein|nr:ABC transporter substrate-binding protein [Propionibacteriaceae bacterium]
MKLTRKRPRAHAFVALAIAAGLALAGCSGESPNSPNADPSGDAGGSNVVLSFGKPDGPQTNNSNPFLSSSAARVMGYAYALYEPLVQVNQIDPAQDPTPWLAESWEWNDDYTAITYTVRDDVTWHDGEPLTADDVAFSIQMRADNEALNAEALPYSSITTDGNKVTVTFETGQFTNTFKVYGLFIVPEHIWSTIADPTTDLNQEPVGSGPYTLTSWTEQAVTLDAYPDYWGGEVAVPQIRYQEFNDNTALTNALVAGDVQWGWTYIANYEEVFTSKDPAYQSWFPSGINADALWFNTAQGPFADLNLRKAAAMVLDREAMSVTGTTGAAAPITSVTGLPTAGESYIADKYKNEQWATDLEGARQLLTDNGYTYDGDALVAPTGEPVSVTLPDPSGWSDYNANLQIIADSFRQLGLDAQINNLPPDQWQEALNVGQFDAALHWTDAGATPYDMYANFMSGSYLAPIGETAVSNFGRFDSPEATAALTTYAATSDDAERTAALETIETIFVEQIPAVSVLERPSWGQYSEKYYTGWPSATDPYADINMTMPAASLILTHLEPVS